MIKAGSIQAHLSEEPELEKPTTSLSRPDLPGGLVIQGTEGPKPALFVLDAYCKPQLSRKSLPKTLADRVDTYLSIEENTYRPDVDTYLNIEENT